MGNFYVDYIKNDNLGRIANAWMAWADFSGADSHQCLQLAALHSTAVDFAKTGIPATFPISLKPPKYPHFMNNAYKAQYESSRVLGQIYSIAKCMKIHTNRFDPHVTLNRSLLHPCYDLTEFLDLSHALMVEYNERLWGIMSHYGVGDEMEALSGFVSQFSRRAAPGDRGGNDVQARLNKAVKGLLIEFRDAFWDSVAEDEGDDGSPSSRVMAMASSWYYCAYSQRHENGIEPLISFPWVVYDILCAMKTAHDKSV
jgi:RNA-dependent RNA polymerase